MIVSNIKNVPGVDVINDAYKNVLGRVLISPETGWEDYVMRMFELGKDGYSADHQHDFPHIVFVLGGTGVLILDGKENPIESGSFAYIPNNSQHQLLNKGTSDEKLKFICIVHQEDHVPFE
jgi:quercetin dioxygenase-like cupin family protein